MLITNSFMLLVIAIKPADFQVALQKAIYRLVEGNEVIVFYEEHDPFSRVGLKMNFYKNKNMRELPLDSLPRYLNGPEKVLIVTSNPYTSLKSEPDFNCVYQNIPDRLLKWNIGDWVSRTWIFSIYERREKPVDKVSPQ